MKEPRLLIVDVPELDATTSADIVNFIREEGLRIIISPGRWPKDKNLFDTILGHIERSDSKDTILLQGPIDYFINTFNDNFFQKLTIVAENSTFVANLWNAKTREIDHGFIHISNPV